jgi:hypothetical protein
LWVEVDVLDIEVLELWLISCWKRVACGAEVDVQKIEVLELWLISLVGIIDLFIFGPNCMRIFSIYFWWN